MLQDSTVATLAKLVMLLWGEFARNFVRTAVANSLCSCRTSWKSLFVVPGP